MFRQCTRADTIISQEFASGIALTSMVGKPRRPLKPGCESCVCQSYRTTCGASRWPFHFISHRQLYPGWRHYSGFVLALSVRGPITGQPPPYLVVLAPEIHLTITHFCLVCNISSGFLSINRASAHSLLIVARSMETLQSTLEFDFFYMSRARNLARCTTIQFLLSQVSGYPRTWRRWCFKY